jgi:hypothetical protein
MIACYENRDSYLTVQIVALVVLNLFEVLYLNDENADQMVHGVIQLTNTDTIVRQFACYLQIKQNETVIHSFKRRILES